ncbi:MAG: hypothetical protein IPM82_29985 [Saprospiraceae bacterium]|nr:hypothetical protein [Saprospiraceae bacterium]
MKAFPTKTQIIEGILFWDSGESYPTKPIKLTLDGSIGDICYSSMVLPVNGLRWPVGKFYLKILVNGQPVAEKPFELIGDNY